MVQSALRQGQCRNPLCASMHSFANDTTDGDMAARGALFGCTKAMETIYSAILIAWNFLPFLNTTFTAVVLRFEFYYNSATQLRHDFAADLRSIAQTLYRWSLIWPYFRLPQCDQTDTIKSVHFSTSGHTKLSWTKGPKFLKSADTT